MIKVFAFDFAKHFVKLANIHKITKSSMERIVQVMKKFVSGINVLKMVMKAFRVMNIQIDPQLAKVKTMSILQQCKKIFKS